MGGNRRDRRDRKNKKVKLPRPFTEEQRNKKVMSIYMQLMNINILHVLTNEIKSKIDNFIKTGEPYSAILDLPEYSRVLEINFINDMNKQHENYIRLKFKRIRVEGDENNPINKLNKIQEGLFNDTGYNNINDNEG